MHEPRGPPRHSSRSSRSSHTHRHIRGERAVKPDTVRARYVLLGRNLLGFGRTLPMKQGILRHLHNSEPSVHVRGYSARQQKGTTRTMTPASRSAEESPPRVPKRRRRLGVVFPVLFAIAAVLGVGAAAYSRGVINDGHTRPAADAHPLDPSPAEPTPTAAASDSHPADAATGKAAVAIPIGKMTIANDYTG